MPNLTTIRGIEYGVAVDSRQKLDAQLQENTLVQKEFSQLSKDANIFKLIGSVLVKQERNEAQTNVDKRIEFINREIERVEKQLADLTAKQDTVKAEILDLQTQFQQAKQALQQ